MVPLLPRMDVCTKFEESRSWGYQVIDWKQKGYKLMANVRSNMPSPLSRGA